MRDRLLFSRKYIKWLIVTFLIGFGLFIRIQNLFHPGFAFDTVYCFYNWGKEAFNQSFGGFWQYYQDWMDYLPGAIYYLMGIYKISLLGGGTAQAFVTTLKIFNCLFDLVIFLSIYHLMILNNKGLFKAILFACVFWVLPANWFISSVWGQIDSVVLALIVVTLILTYIANQQNSLRLIIVGGITFAIAFWIKLQTFLFVPIIGLFFIMVNNWRLCRRFIASFVLASIIIIIPAVTTNSLRLGMNLLTPFTRQDRLSRSASDFWVLINTNFDSTQRLLSQLPITYGVIAIVVFSIIIIGLLVYKRKNVWWNKYDFTILLFWGVLFLLSYFIFMPKMYERYLYPGLILLFILIPFIKSSRYQLAVIIAATIANIGSFINLIDVYHYWNYTTPEWVGTLWQSISFNPFRFAAGIILLSYIILIGIYIKLPKPKSLKDLLRT